MQSSSRGRGRPQRRARPRKVDQESEDEIMPQRKRRQTDIRKTRETSSSRRRGRNVKRPVYFENDEDDLPPEPETRPKRDISSKRSRDQDAYQEESSAAAASDGNDSEENWDDESEMDDTLKREKAYLRKKKKKNTVTSRGRVSKPNPRIHSE